MTNRIKEISERFEIEYFDINGNIDKDVSSTKMKEWLEKTLIEELQAERNRYLNQGEFGRLMKELRIEERRRIIKMIEEEKELWKGTCFTEGIDKIIQHLK